MPIKNCAQKSKNIPSQKKIRIKKRSTRFPVKGGKNVPNFDLSVFVNFNSLNIRAPPCPHPLSLIHTTIYYKYAPRMSYI